jgi:predicted Zn-dependent protease with MMP-like domain
MMNSEFGMGKDPRVRKQYPPLAKKYLDRVDRAWDALEDGDPETAGLEAEEMMSETEEHPEVRFLLGAALLESGVPGEALEHLQSCEGQVEDPVVHRFYLASALYENLRVEEAEKIFLEVIEEEPDAAPPYYGLAQCLEFTRRYTEAEEKYEKAHEMDEEGFPLPTRMKREAFERVVHEAAGHLPEDIREHLKQIPIVVEDLPTREILLSESDEEPVTPSVLGLFVGQSLKDRSVFNPVTLPATIFVYQRNLERFCQTREELIHEIRLTLYHELGHYLGLSEEELEERGLE